MAELKEIKISMAKSISKITGYPEIIIVGYDPVSGQQHVTTYGETKAQCLDAEKAGNFIKKACNWPDDLCHAEPDLRVKLD